MSFKNLVKSERTRIEKTRAKLVQDRAAIDAKIDAIDTELAAMSAYEKASGGAVKTTTTRKPAAKPATAAKRTVKTAAKPAAKPAAKTTAKAPAKTAAKTTAKVASTKTAAAKPATKAAAKPAAKAATKTTAKAAKPAVKAAAKAPARASTAGSKPVAGRRDIVLNLISGRAQGMSRSDLIAALDVKGDKKAEKSISNALADLKKQNAIRLENGVYLSAAAKPTKTAQVLQMPKAAKPSTQTATKAAGTA